jgi:hypothetical protein
MNTTQRRIEALAGKLKACLEGEGLKPEVTASKYGTLVTARLHEGGDYVRVVVHIADRDAAVPSNFGTLEARVARTNLVNAEIRPTLSMRASAGAGRARSAVRYPLPDDERKE